MVFSSVTFLIYFLPIVLILYYAAPIRAKNLILLVVSLFFYAWGEPVYVFLMIFSIVINYSFGLVLDKMKHLSRRKVKLVLAADICVNIALIGFFKYGDFLIININLLLGTSIALLELPLPIGISFYTFQAMSYGIDLYRGDVKLQKNIIDFGTYIALFPQLIAGPIVRLSTIEKQLRRREHNAELFASGVRRFVIGLGKKVLLANNIGIVWDRISGMDFGTMPSGTAWLGIAAFTFQIYFDFSGYSDMAIGLGRMFGFEFNENFNYPYMSKSITEFWRRWHISLSSWFRDYLYIPLGGNRRGLIRQLRNILTVWLLTGLWHGASWNFVMWGLYFGILLIIEKMFIGRLLEKMPAWIRHVYTMVLVMISWVIFSLESPSDIFTYIGAMFGESGAGFADDTTKYIALGNLLLYLVLICGSTSFPKKSAESLMQRSGGSSMLPAILENLCLGAVLILSIAYVTASTYNPFLYFRF